MGPLRVFITGASSGLGEALATTYASRGAHLGLLARRSDVLEALRARLTTPCEIYAADVRDGAAVAGAGASFIEKAGGADIVIANAGISIGTTAESADDLAVLEEVIAANLLGVAQTVQAFIGPMRAARRGKLVGIASVAGYRGLPGAGAYSASKAAVISYLEAARVELHGSGVEVITVSPGYIATPMTESNPYRMPFRMTADEAAAKIVRAIDAGRSYSVIPWQMAIVARVLRLMPNAVYDRLFARAPRKPRRTTQP